MGLDETAYSFIRYCSNIKPLDRVLTLGRQTNNLGSFHKGSCFQAEYSEQILIDQFRATEVCSVDASSYEDCTFIQDLNEKWTNVDLIREKYDTILDIGTLEHVFNVPQALNSIADACKVDGTIIHVQIFSDFCGHGLWHFSPELFFGWYSEKNGFAGTEIFLAPLNNLKTWYRCLPPRNGGRCELSGRNVPQSYVLVKTTKLHHVDSRVCYQSDYIDLWARNSTSVAIKRTMASNRLILKLKQIAPRKLKLLTSRIVCKLSNLNAPWWRHSCIQRVYVKKLLEN